MHDYAGVVVDDDGIEKDRTWSVQQILLELHQLFMTKCLWQKFPLSLS